ncbi:hypothetical protein R6Q57_004394 [Mikania cordata]
MCANMLKPRLLFSVILITTIESVFMKAVMGEVYNVGDFEGWTNLIDSGYASWASSKKFRVGDTLLFHYNLTNHNVMQVNQHDFRSCNVTAPWRTFKTGNDSFIIKAPGHYYFICSFPGHCEAGQKLDVRVLKSYNLTTTPNTNVSSPMPPKMTVVGSGSAVLTTDPGCLLRSIVLSTLYMVGDDQGWTNIGHVDYRKWASTKSFRVGDTIVFSYVKVFHDVARVSYTDFKTCNGTKPYTTFTTGHDSFQIKYPGHYFFICTQPDHCAAGEKVDIRVPFVQNHSAPPPISADSPAPVQPLPFPYPQPYVPSPAPVTLPHAPLQAPASSLSPAPTPTVPAPSEQKSEGSQLGFEFKIWKTMMLVFFYLIGFSF